MVAKENLQIAVTFTRVISVIAGLLALYELVIASRILTWFGIFLPAAQHRAISLFFALILIYAMRSFQGKTRQPGLTWYDMIFLVAGLAGAGYVAFNHEAVVDYSTYGYLDTFGIVLTLILAVSLFECSRRLIGWSLIVIIVFFGLIAGASRCRPSRRPP